MTATLSLRATSLAGVALIITLLTTVVAVWVGDIAGKHLEEQSTVSLTNAARNVAGDMAMAMEERYVDVAGARDLLEHELAHLDDNAIRTVLERLRDSFRYYSWLGVTDATGRVRVGTAHLLEGWSVAGRDWFQNAREKPFFGSAHPALLLQPLLPNADGAPLYLLDIALPLRDEQGRFIGVVGSHLNWQLMARMARHGLDVQSDTAGGAVSVIDRKGQVIHDSQGWQGDVVPLLRGITEGEAKRVSWPGEGAVYMAVATVPRQQAFDGLGWRVVVRHPVTMVEAGVKNMRAHMVLVASAVAGVILLIGWLVMRRFTQPLEQLVAHMDRFAAVEEPPGAAIPSPVREIDRLQAAFRHMAGEVAANTRDLELTRLEVIRSLARAGELRDNETGNHVTRMSQCCGHLAELAGVDTADAFHIQVASQMHDLGKIGISDQILLKPGRLTPEERAVMERHSAIGAAILGHSQAPLIALARTIALTHHERWDGKGYPHGLAGEAIPLEGRITALCDVFDALLSSRPYKEGWPLDKTVALIAEEAGRQFDPRLARLFLDHLQDFVIIREHNLD